jgi:hypothetical protein
VAVGNKLSMLLRFFSWPSILAGLMAAALALFALWPIPSDSIATIGIVSFLLAALVAELILKRRRSANRPGSPES